MAVRIRKDGTILCAAKHPEEEGDTYLHDGLHYHLSVQLGALVTEPMTLPEGEGFGGLGGHKAHGLWWWVDEIPEDAVIEQQGLVASLRRVNEKAVHDTKRKIMDCFTNGEAYSPSQLSQKLGIPLGNVSYHVKVLAQDMGELELVRTKPVRGAVEHFYRRTHGST